MSTDVPNEIVIVRRRSGGDEDGHKSSAWKIAYADFMTAMMALFLVMWLVNASDQSTRQQVANYFNPIRLTDLKAQPKGVRDILDASERLPGDDGEGDRVTGSKRDGTTDPERDQSSGPGSAGPASGRVSERMAEHVAASGLAPPPVPQDSVTEIIVPLSEPAFRDPFAPVGAGRSATPDVDALTLPTDAVDRAAAVGDGAADGLAASPEVEATKADQLQRHVGDPVEPLHSETGAHAANRTPRLHDGAPSQDTVQRPDAKAVARRVDELRRDIADALRDLGDVAMPSIEVTREPEGLLLSLTDDTDFGMFAIASAEPEPRVSQLMSRIANVLAVRNGAIVVRGHTDGRPFRTAENDNWKLSTARAHAAYTMLLGGNLSEARIERIEGHADRRLRVPSNPEASRNRRIEILIRDEVG